MASARAGEEQISRRSSTYCGFALLVDSVEDAYVLRVWPEADLAGKPAEFAMPNVLVKLALDHDRMFNY